jgi:glycolate oxidase iron-sulfur subunit
VAFAKNRGLSRLAGALGLLRIFGRDFARVEQIVQHFPERAFRDQEQPAVVPGEGTIQIGYFVGCGTDIMCPETAGAVVSLLRRVGRTVEVLENCCCGLPAITYGDRSAAQSLAERNGQLIDASRFDILVTDCSNCASFLKSYPELFPRDDPRHQQVAQLAARVRDLVEVLSEYRPQDPLPPGKKIVATYHDPCHAVRGQKLVRQPREILRSLPNVEYRELPEADWCCGGAGSYAVSHYALASRVLDRKMDNLQRTGANLLVTSCPACIIHLRHGVHRRALPVRVCHLAELVSPPSEGGTASVAKVRKEH